MAGTRTREDMVRDAALLLTLWARCSTAPEKDLGDRLRLMKLAFLAQHRFVAARLRALNLSFYRWTWGPLSNEVYDAWNALTRAGLMEEDERFVLTPRGRSLAEAFFEEVVRAERNVMTRETIDAVAGRWRDAETPKLLDAVYGMSIVLPGENRARPVRSIEAGVELLRPLSPDEARVEFDIDSGWMETLAVMFNPASMRVIAEAEGDFRAGRVIGVAAPQ